MKALSVILLLVALAAVGVANQMPLGTGGHGVASLVVIVAVLAAFGCATYAGLRRR